MNSDDKPSHLHQWRFVVHPLPNEFLFGAEGLALPGAELSVLLPLTWCVQLVGALQMGESGAFRTQPLSEGDLGFEDLIYPLRLVQFFDISDTVAIQMGLNGVLGTSPSAPERNNRSTALGVDTFLKENNLVHDRVQYPYCCNAPLTCPKLSGPQQVTVPSLYSPQV